MTNAFDKAVMEVLPLEAGYSNDPNDSGGETNFGITVAVARAFGYTKPMKDMVQSDAIPIYKARYWDSLLLDQVSQSSEQLATLLFKDGVNVGIDRVCTFLQRSLNVLNMQGEFYPDIKADGNLGPMTLASLREYLRRRPEEGVSVLLKCINSLLGAFYVELAEQRQKDETFIFGWMSKRVL